MRPELILPLIAVIAVVYVLLPVGLAMRARYRRPKLVRCPLLPCEATIAVRGAALAEALGVRSLRRVRACSLWPRHRGCAEACLALPEVAIRDVHRAV